MTFFKAKLKSSGVKASPCFRPLKIGKLSEKCLPIQTIIYVSIKHNLISLTSFMGTTNSVRLLYNTSLLSEPYAFLNAINRRCAVSFYSHPPPTLPVSEECK
jgi:hypothetical protein